MSQQHEGHESHNREGDEFDSRDHEAWFRLDQEGMSDREAAAMMGISQSGARGMASRYRNRIALQQATEQSPPSRSVLRQVELADQSFERWKIAQAEWPATVRVAMWNDVHLPYQDDHAIDLACLITEDWKPQITTTMSDEGDFPAMSSFQDKRAPFLQQWDNDLENLLVAMDAYVARQRDAAPGATLVALPGNHDWRIFNWLRANAANVSEFTLAQFLERLTRHGVLWLGHHLGRNDSLRLNQGLILQHGVYASQSLEGTMKKTLDDYRSQVSVAFGHVHRSGMRQWRGLDHNIWAASSGCLCKVDPHYHNRVEDWHQSIILVEFERGGWWHRLMNVEFSERHGNLTARANGKEYEVKRRVYR